MKGLISLLFALAVALSFVAIAAANPPSAPPAACPAQVASFFGPSQQDSTLGQFFASQAQSNVPYGKNDVSGFAQTDPPACFG
jgi:hypothetical protein